MSGRPWFPWYPADFLAKTLDLTLDQQGAYRALLDLTWLQPECALPNDMDWLKRTLKACVKSLHGHTFNAIVLPILERYFVLDADGKWRNSRLTKEYFKALKISSNARQSVLKRWSKNSNINGLTNTTAILSTSTKKESSIFSDSATGPSPTANTNRKPPPTTPTDELAAIIRRKGWIE